MKLSTWMGICLVLGGCAAPAADDGAESSSSDLSLADAIAAARADGRISAAEVHSLVLAARAAPTDYNMTPAGKATLSALVTSAPPTLFTPEALFLVRGALQLSNRKTFTARQRRDIDREEAVDLDRANALLEMELRDDGEFRYGPVPVGDVIEWKTSDKWTAEGRRRLELGSRMVASAGQGSLAVLNPLWPSLFMMEREGGAIDRDDVRALAKKLSTDVPAYSSAEVVRGLADAYRAGLRIDADAKADFEQLIGAQLHDGTGVLASGPDHLGSTVPSRQVFANRHYRDTPTSTLVAVRGISTRLADFAVRANGLARASGDPNVLRVGSLVVLEDPAQAAALSEQEKFFVYKAFRAVERREHTAVVPAALVVPPLEKLIRAPIVEPPPLDLTGSLPLAYSYVAGALSKSSADEALLRRVERLFDGDHNADTVSLADLDAALASAVGFTDAEHASLTTLRARAEDLLRLRPARPFSASLGFTVPLAKPVTTALFAPLALEAQSTTRFTADFRLPARFRSPTASSMLRCSFAPTVPRRSRCRRSSTRGRSRSGLLRWSPDRGKSTPSIREERLPQAIASTGSSPPRTSLSA